MKNIHPTYTLIIILFFSIFNSQAQVVVQSAEYFWDTDPGLGNGNSISAQDGNFDEAIEDLFKAGVSTSGLSLGSHSFYVRIKGSDGQWSNSFRNTVFINGINTTISRSCNVMQGEYFWDNDPGEGNGSLILALDGNFDEALESLFETGISIVGLSIGPHNFNVRVKGNDGQWSQVFQSIIQVDGIKSTISRTSEIIQGEYFWDNDPGEGSGIPILALDGSFDGSLETLSGNISTSTVTSGPHLLQVRIKDGLNSWSTPFKQCIFIDGVNNLTETTEVNFDVYPNPSSGIFQVASNVREGEAYVIKNTQGESVLESKLRSTIDLRSLSKGVYFLTIESERITKRIIVH